MDLLLDLRSGQDRYAANTDERQQTSDPGIHMAALAVQTHEI